MAGFAAITAVGKSLEMLLTACFAAEPPVDSPTPVKAVLARTDDFEKKNGQSILVSPVLSIFLYRVDFNKTMRAAWSGAATKEGRAQLALDLHYLLTPWASNAEDEQCILGKALQCLETTPILSGPLLHADGDWAPDESIQLVMEEISTEAVMRTFDSLPTDYRLSVPYIARVIRLEGRQEPAAGPVLTAITGVKPGTQP